MSPDGRMMRDCTMPKPRVWPDWETVSVMRAASSGWVIGQLRWAASSKVSSRPMISPNWCEHQKVRFLKSVSNTPACPASSAIFSRSAVCCASWRSSATASSWRLRASMSR